ncbi:uncharacterized protein LOC113793745 [Dermatophagoides pteronyssinus]|uniref:uncharacterized protein LOC113793745 n=1 Tax=Dermatophagoides pteronyssinus TaxID=6956 RepID=UPI003F6632FE
MISNKIDINNDDDDDDRLSNMNSVLTKKFDSVMEMVTKSYKRIQPKTNRDNFGQMHSESPGRIAKHLVSITENLDYFNNSSKTFEDLPKRPGWRCPTSLVNKSMTKNLTTIEPTTLTTNVDRELEVNSNEKFESITMIKSDTSISTNGPLKEFIRKQKPNFCHQPKIKFKLDPNLIIEAAKRAEILDQQPIRQPSLSSISDSEKKKPIKQQQQPKKSASKEKSTMINKSDKQLKSRMIIDENIGPLIRESLQRVKVFSLKSDIQEIESSIDSLESARMSIELTEQQKTIDLNLKKSKNL